MAINLLSVNFETADGLNIDLWTLMVELPLGVKGVQFDTKITTEPDDLGMVRISYDYAEVFFVFGEPHLPDAYGTPTGMKILNISTYGDRSGKAWDIMEFILKRTMGFAKGLLVWDEGSVDSFELRDGKFTWKHLALGSR